MNMRAFVLTRYGGPDAMKLRDVPRPSPGPGEVLIHVYAAGLNPIDFKMREGMLRVIYCHSRHKMAASAFNCHFAGFVQPIFTLKSAPRPERMISSQALKALEKLIKSVRQICTLGHFMVFLATCSFVSCASNYLLRGQDMPFLRPFYAVSDIYRYPLPIIAGSELSGVVVAKGSGVTSLAEGDRVFTRVDKKRLGAFAEFAVVREELVAKMPSSVDFTTAAGVPLAGLTALQALRDELRVTSGQNIFISGGSGGVGTFAIQLGKWLGAHIATTASARGEEMVRKLGADIVVDYTREHFDQVLREYDGAFDLRGGDTLLKTFGVVKRGAKVVSIAGVPEPQTASKDLQAGPPLATLFWAASWRIRRQADKHGVIYRYLLMHPSGTDLSELATLIDQQKLEIVIDRVFPFAHIADAFAYLEQGHAKGKVVVQMVEQL